MVLHTLRRAPVRLATRMPLTKTARRTFPQEMQKTPVGPGPLAEIEFWRQRNAVVGSLYEQMNAPAVQRVVQVVELGSQDKKLLR